MAEYSPFGPESTEDDDDELEQSSSSTRKKRSSGMGASILNQEVKKEAEKPVPRSFKEALDALIGDKKTEKENAAKQPGWKEAVESNEHDQVEIVGPEHSAATQSVATAERQAPEENPENEVFHIRELRPNEVYGGEAVVSLDDPAEAARTEAFENDPVETDANEAVITEEELSIQDEIVQNELNQPEAIEEEQDEAVSSDPTAVAGGSGANSARTTPGGSGSTSGSSTQAPRPVPLPTTPPVPPTPPIPPVPGGSMPPPSNAAPVPPQFNTILVPDMGAEQRGHRRGFRRGFIGGLLIGGGIEHIRHRRRERRMEHTHAKELNTKDAALVAEQKSRQIEDEKRMNKDYWERKRQERETEAAQQHTQQEIAQSTEPTEVERVNRDKKTDAEAVAPKFAETQVSTPEAVAIAPIAYREKPPQDKDKSLSAVQEQKPDMKEVDDGPENHLEQSAWHAIEVDASGHAVQNSRIEYGQAFASEQAKEKQPNENVHTTLSSVGAVGVATAASAAHDTHQEHLDRVKHSAGLSGAQTEDLQKANQNSLGTTLKKFAGPPTTALGTLAWAVILVALVIIGAVIFI